MTTLRNPVLRGFNPDPSICRVGDDYYLATSTFEWLPGVALYHSRDLRSWRSIGHALTEPRHANLLGVDNSSGLWAPSLSFAEGRFWLIYTVVRTRVGPFKDLKNFLVTAPSIEGPWSDPAFLNASGFDPSLFHDDDGRKWLVNMRWDFRKGKPRFGGIELQEYSPAEGRLLGEPRTILRKDRLIEGPNLYKRDGTYYLMLAEGGTGWNHGIAMARSRSVEGPYELDPQDSVMTTRHDLVHPLQKAGHGELMEDKDGQWWLAHLASRPLAPERRCVLGRETCLQRVVWTDDGWLRLASGGILPELEVALPESGRIEDSAVVSLRERDDFDGEALGEDWQCLRCFPDEEWLDLKSRPGWLRLRGRESLHSLFEQSLVAQRVVSSSMRAETCLEFSPRSYSQSAGLVFWYDTRQHYYLRVTCDEHGRTLCSISLTDDGVYDELLECDLELTGSKRVYLRGDLDGAELRFSLSIDGLKWQRIGPVLDASKLSDDYGQGLRFTGAMVGLAAQDLGAGGALADFDYFELRDKSSREPV